MTADITRHVIRSRPGYLRVLRLILHGRRLYLMSYDAKRGPGTCEWCGCTDIFACAGPCFWMDAAHTVCSACAEELEVIE